MDAAEIQKYIDEFIDWAIHIGPRIILVIILLIFGFWAIKKVTNVLGTRLDKSKMDKSVAPFIKSMISALMKVILLIVVASTAGIDTTSFIAIMGAITLAIGMALQGSLANFAGGMLILIFKPFKVGDIIEAQGFVGVVEEIQVFKTTIIAVDRKIFIIPNGVLSNGTITNNSAKKVLRVNMKAWIGYDDDIELAKKLAMEAMLAHPMVVDEPKPRVRVFQLEKDAVVLGIHPYVETYFTWDVYFDIQEEIVLAFRKHGIRIPRHKLDVNMAQNEPTPGLPPVG